MTNLASAANGLRKSCGIAAVSDLWAKNTDNKA
jgi:hypothetical protein